MTDVRPPRLPESLLAAIGADSQFSEDVLGDLAEEFAQRARWDGPAAARRWYWRESARVTPYLLRDWYLSLRWHRTGELATSLVGSAAAIVVVENVLQGVVHALQRASGHGVFAPFMNQRSFQLLLFMLGWTIVDGAVTGWIAARVARRAPLPSVLISAAIWSTVLAVLSPPTAVTWYRVANSIAVVAGIVGGGLVQMWRRGAGSDQRLDPTPVKERRVFGSRLDG